MHSTIQLQIHPSIGSVQAAWYTCIVAGCMKRYHCTHFAAVIVLHPEGPFGDILQAEFPISSCLIPVIHLILNVRL